MHTCNKIHVEVQRYDYCYNSGMNVLEVTNHFLFGDMDDFLFGISEDSITFWHQRNRNDILENECLKYDFCSGREFKIVFTEFHQCSKL